MTDPVALASALLLADEGLRRFAYDDSTGKQVTCKPHGNLSIACGINLEIGLDDAEIHWLLQHRVGLVSERLCQQTWYQGMDPVRQAAFLNAGYNLGVDGLMGFHATIAAAARRDWDATADALLDSDAARQLPARYGRLALMIRSGSLPAR